jgi:hypothetical protein
MSGGVRNCRSALADALAIGHCACAMWFVVLAFLSLFGYGVLNVVAPRTTLAWQIRSTARHSHGDPRGSVSRSFQRLLGINPEAPTDGASLRRIRIIGVTEILISLVVIGVVYGAMS